LRPREASSWRNCVLSFSIVNPSLPLQVPRSLPTRQRRSLKVVLALSDETWRTDWFQYV
jgi:hypothetical protein